FKFFDRTFPFSPQQFMARLADCFGFRKTIELLGSPIPVIDLIADLPSEDRIKALFEQVCLLLKGIDTLLSSGYVADHREQIAVGHYGRQHFAREFRSVLAPKL